MATTAFIVIVVLLIASRGGNQPARLQRKQCPRCGGVFPARANFCGRCGAAFAGDGRAARRQARDAARAARHQYRAVARAARA